MQRPNASAQFTVCSSTSTPLYPARPLSPNSAIAAGFAPRLSIPQCSQLYVQGWQQQAFGHSEAALRAFRELLIHGRQTGHQGWIGAATQAIADVSTEPSLSALATTFAETVSQSDFSTAQHGQRADELHRLGHDPEAIQVYQTVLAFATQAGHAFAMGRCLNGLGLIYLEQQQFALAATRFRAAVEVLADITAPVQSAIACHNLGLAYYQQGHYDQARTHLQRALHHWQSTEEDSLGLALTLDYLGRIYAKQGEAWLALGSFEAATDVINGLAEQQDVRPAAADLLMQLADLCEQTQHFYLAIAYWQAVLEISQSLGTPRPTTFIEQRLAQLYTKAGHTAIARCYAQCQR